MAKTNLEKTSSVDQLLMVGKETEKPNELQVYSQRDRSKKNGKSFDLNMVLLENICNLGS